MNLVEFLKDVDGITGRLSKKQLTQFIHQAARSLPESKRDSFLAQLRLADNSRDPIPISRTETEKLRQEAKEIREKLEAIQKGDLCLDSELNQEYDDWYDTSDSEFLFSDPQGVAGILEDAAAFLYVCNDLEDYSDAYDIGQTLMGLKIPVQGDYKSYMEGELPLQEMADRNLTKLSDRMLVTDVLYAAYFAADPSKRPEVLFRIFETYKRHDVSLEDIMQRGKELPDLDAFLLRWMDYLGNQTSSNAARLLQEASALTANPEQMLETARSFYEQHPGLYETYLKSNLESGRTDPATLLQIGKEALDNINPNYLVRSRIALLTARIALKAGETAEAERCWLEAFRSDTSVLNFMRLFMECGDYKAYRRQVQEICSPYLKQGKDLMRFSSRSGELAKNEPEFSEAAMLGFFCGEFQLVAGLFMNGNDPYGWIGNFMQCGVAAFLLLLLEGENLGPGCTEMRRTLNQTIRFSVEEYNAGLAEEEIQDSDSDWFWECFCCWKNSVSLSKEDREKCIQWLEKLMMKHVVEIMEGNHRHHYGECAAYLAAIGEVRESWGVPGMKQAFMQSYWELYPRRSSFARELEAFGMKR